MWLLAVTILFVRFVPVVIFIDILVLLYSIPLHEYTTIYLPVLPVGTWAECSLGLWDTSAVNILI